MPQRRTVVVVAIVVAPREVFRERGGERRDRVGARRLLGQPARGEVDALRRRACRGTHAHTRFTHRPARWNMALRAARA
jgi:hypothetical protein